MREGFARNQKFIAPGRRVHGTAARDLCVPDWTSTPQHTGFGVLGTLFLFCFFAVLVPVFEVFMKTRRHVHAQNGVANFYRV
jgi:hypothetical protein